MATSTKAGKKITFPCNGPSSRVETLYALPGSHLTGEEAPEGIRFAYLHRFENSQWEGK